LDILPSPGTGESDFKPTDEDPPRTRVYEFPNPSELAELQKHVI
jgi:hypothetical protein